MGARFESTLGLALLLVVPGGLTAQTTCVRGKETNTSFPFFGAAQLGTQNVTLYLSDSARSATFLQQGRLEAGVAKWAICASGDNTPGFSLNTTAPRPNVPDIYSDAYRSTMLIEFSDTPAPVLNNRSTARRPPAPLSRSRAGFSTPTELRR